MKNTRKSYITYFALFCALLLSCLSVVQAKTFIVNADTDLKDLSPGDGVCNAAVRTCTLRAAVEEANAQPGDDVIQFDASFQAPNAPRRITLTLDRLFVKGGLTVEGPGARQLAIDGKSATRLMRITSDWQNPFQVTLNNLTLENGKPDPQDYTQQGAGIYNQYANLTLNGVTMNNNQLPDAAGYNIFYGGAIFNHGGNVKILNSTFSNNYAETGGGAIFSDWGSLTVYNSTITNNSSRKGGGILLRDGGSIINSTITNNTALENGGGYATEAGDLGAYRVRYFGNTIVANNQAGFDKDIHGVIHSLGNNLVRSRGASTGYIAADLPDGTDPKLGNLKNNGGQTDTRALLNTSPAINAGNNCLLPGNACVTGSDTDQRGFGFARKNGSAVDIGAYEFLLVAAPFPIGGRVFKSNGRGLGNALVTLTAEDGTTRTVEADAKGRFSFDNLEKGKSYVIKVENSLVEYEPQTIVVTEARDNVNLVPVATEAPAEFPQQ